MKQGWECPKCSAVMSPMIPSCINCTGKKIEIHSIEEIVDKYLEEDEEDTLFEPGNFYRSFDQYTKDYKEVFALWSKGWSYREIVTKLNLSLTSVRIGQIVHTAKAKLYHLKHNKKLPYGESYHKKISDQDLMKNLPKS